MAKCTGGLLTGFRALPAPQPYLIHCDLCVVRLVDARRAGLMGNTIQNGTGSISLLYHHLCTHFDLPYWTPTGSKLLFIWPDWFLLHSTGSLYDFSNYQASCFRLGCSASATPPYCCLHNRLPSVTSPRLGLF